MEKIDLKRLAEHDGKDGRAAYVAHQGKVYDVSGSKLWRKGLHMKRHHAGSNLTTDLHAAPHGPEVLERYPQIGELVDTTPRDVNVPPLLARVLKSVPMLRRHPHPMTVHFPIVFMVSVSCFNLLYLITGVGSFETTAFHCLGAGILFSIVAMLTGWYTWWLNYLSKPTRAVNIKKRLSPLMLVVASSVFIWRLQDPGVLLQIDSVGSVVYLILVLSLFPLVTVIGWFGAQLTFPVEEE